MRVEEYLNFFILRMTLLPLYLISCSRSYIGQLDSHLQLKSRGNIELFDILMILTGLITRKRFSFFFFISTLLLYIFFTIWGCATFFSSSFRVSACAHMRTLVCSHTQKVKLIQIINYKLRDFSNVPLGT